MPGPSKVTPDWVTRTATEQHWSPQARARALQLVLAPPDLPEWRHFLDWLLLSLGSLALLCGVIFFVAANWDALGAFGKFLLLDAALLGSAIGAYRLGLDRPPGQWCLTVASGLVGAFLALYGQTYQTGADPYTLFLGWALLILPWCLLAEHPPLWAGWVVVANLALGLALPHRPAEYSICLFVLGNVVLWIVVEVRRPHLGWPTLPWATALVASSLAVVIGLMEHHELFWTTTVPTWVLFGGGSAVHALKTGTHRARLAALGSSLVLVDTVWLAQSLPWHDAMGTSLALALWAIVQVTVLATGLRRLEEPGCPHTSGEGDP